MSSEPPPQPPQPPPDWKNVKDPSDAPALPLPSDRPDAYQPQIPPPQYAVHAQQPAPAPAPPAGTAHGQHGVPEHAAPARPAVPVEQPPPAPPPGPPDSGFAQPFTYGRPHPAGAKPRGLPGVRQAVPDTVLDGADFEGLTVRGVSIRGEDHRYYAEPRQDSMALWTLARTEGPDLLLACVADGVGSEPLSYRGSEMACRSVYDEVAAYAADLLVEGGPPKRIRETGRRIVDGVARRLAGHAADNGHDPRSLSTTLVAAIVELTPPDRPRRCVLLRVGDSTAYLLRDGAFEECVHDVHQEETIVSSGTDALPGHAGRADVGEVLIGNDDVLLVCTDGLANPMRSDGVRERLVDWWSAGPVPGVLEYGWQLSFRAKSYGDDRTAVCVWGR